VQGISMLNPQRWGGSSGNGAAAGGYSKNLEKDGGTLFEVTEEDEVEVSEQGEKVVGLMPGCKSLTVPHIRLLSLNRRF
jgi:hypothetical protein